jgi:hypothetical protein
MVAAGVAFVALCPLLAAQSSKGVLVIVLLAGVVMRAASFTTPPLVEDDYHRYTLDGAMTAAMLDPFAASPEKLLRGDADDARLAVINDDAARAHLERINHPHLRTIYPPTSQAAFAAAHMIDPWSVDALRLVFVIVELGAAAAIVVGLRKLSLPVLLVGVYWLNPIVVGQIVLQAHMDVLVYAPVAAALAARMFGRYGVAGGFLGLAIGAKLWPILLLPALASPWLGSTKRDTARFVTCSMVVAAACLLPGLTAFGENSGLEAYTATWENNAFLFSLIEDAFAWLIAWVGMYTLSAGAAARLTVVTLVGVAALLAARPGDVVDLPRRLLTVIAVLFFLSPTQFPWYFTWLAPLLPFLPRSMMRLSIALLPLYYLVPAAGWLPIAQHAPPLAAGGVRRLLGGD